MFANYVQYEYLLAQIQLVFFMLGMGATLTVPDFLKIVKRPRSLLVGVGYHLAFVPLIAIGVNYVAPIEIGICVGIIVVAAMPGGNLSKLFTYLGKGNIALSISLSAVTHLLAIITIPILLFIAHQLYPYQSDDFPKQFAWLIIRDVALFLLLPLAIGMIAAQHMPEFRKRFARWCIRIGFVFVIIMITGSVASQRIGAWDYGWRAPLAIITFCVVAQQLAMLPFRLRGWPRADTFSVGIEVTMRNINLALLLKALLFPARSNGADPIADGVLFVILYYAVASLVVGVCLTLNFRRLYRKEKRLAAVQAPRESPATPLSGKNHGFSA